MCAMQQKYVLCVGVTHTVYHADTVCVLYISNREKRETLLNIKTELCWAETSLDKMILDKIVSL